MCPNEKPSDLRLRPLCCWAPQILAQHFRFHDQGDIEDLLPHVCHVSRWLHAVRGPFANPFRNPPPLGGMSCTICTATERGQQWKLPTLISPTRCRARCVRARARWACLVCVCLHLPVCALRAVSACTCQCVPCVLCLLAPASVCPACCVCLHLPVCALRAVPACSHTVHADAVPCDSILCSKLQSRKGKYKHKPKGKRSGGWRSVADGRLSSRRGE
jgi:hypothetical protein